MKQLLIDRGMEIMALITVLALGFAVHKHMNPETVKVFQHPGNVELFVTHPITGEYGSLQCYTDQPGDIQLGIDVGGHTQSYNCTRGTEHALE